MWDRNTLECVQILTGHTGSVLCLQYDENIIISGSSDSTVRYKVIFHFPVHVDVNLHHEIFIYL